MSKRTPKLYLEDVLTSIKKIEEYTRGLSFEQFQPDTKTIDAVIRNLEIIGEAARRMSRNFAADHPEIPWEKMISMRNKVLHEYFGVDVEILWQTIQEDLPPLRKQMEKLSEALAT